MPIWILLLVLLLLALVLLARQRNRQLRRGAEGDPMGPVAERSRGPTAELPAPRTLFNLRQGDIVQFDGQDWVVEDRLLYDDDGFRWLEYLLRDGRERRWLSVVEDDWLELGWLEPAPPELVDGLTTLPARFPQRIEWDGIAYRRRETGTATMTASSRAMNQRQGGCRYGDYEAEGERLLAVEVWGSGGADDPGEVEASLGRRIDPGLVSLLPGDGRSVYR
jgi:hypothetical protein